MIEDRNLYGDILKSKEAFRDFLYTYCTKEERHQILVRLGKQIVEGE